MPLKLNNQLRTVLLVLIKLLIVGLIAFMLYQKLKSHENIFEEIASEISHALFNEYLLYLLVIILMVFNWGLEALKWRLLTSSIINISLWQAFKGVLSGLTLSFVTPHGVGDYFGRILSIQSIEREKLIGSLFLGRTSQMVATVLFGLVGLSYIYPWHWIFYVVLGFAIIVFICFWFLKLATRNKLIRKYLTIIFKYKYNELIVVQTLSIGRYLIFTLQFLIILFIYIPELSLSLGFAGTSYIFLAKSVLPTFNFLSDLGIREYAAISFFERYNVALIPVLSASLTVWVINILIPTIAGIPLMLKMKWQRS